MDWVAAQRGFDEALSGDGAPRPLYRPLVRTLQEFDRDDVTRREQLQQVSLINQGITFTVYGAENTTERVMPTDLFPRIIPADEWKRIELGLAQRLQALNLFLADIYGDQQILMDGVVPRELVLGAPIFHAPSRPRRALDTPRFFSEPSTCIFFLSLSSRARG